MACRDGQTCIWTEGTEENSVSERGRERKKDSFKKTVYLAFQAVELC